MEAYKDIQKGERGAWFSIIAYLVFSAVKLISGYYYQSSALMADGFNNLTDIVASTAILIGMRISRKPPDSDHAYGHFRAETVAVLVASFIMATVGIQVLLDGISGLFRGSHPTPDPISSVIALVSAAGMFGVYVYNRNLAKKINNQALMAASKDNLSDALVSIGAAIGIFGSQLGLPWLDTVAAISVGFVICKTAWDIFWDATYRLTDGFDETELFDLRSSISQIDGVEGIRDVRARIHGNHVLVDVVIEVDPYLTVTEAHIISDRVEEEICRIRNVIDVHVHVEPKNSVNKHQR